MTCEGSETLFTARWQEMQSSDIDGSLQKPLGSLGSPSQGTSLEMPRAVGAGPVVKTRGERLQTQRHSSSAQAAAGQGSQKQITALLQDVCEQSHFQCTPLSPLLTSPQQRSLH